MLKYIYYRIFFAGLVLLTLALDWFYEIPIWVYLLIFVLHLAFAFYGSYFIQSGFYVKSIWHGNKQRRAVALTFDDGPSPNHTPAVLDILENENVKAAFFVIGKNISGNEDLLRRMDKAGHIIGNHSFEHNFWYSMKGKQEMLSDMGTCDNTVQQITGKCMKYFRPPYGVTNPWLGKAVREGKYHCMGWSLRTYDTTIKSKEALVRKCITGLKNGDVILLHDWAPYTLAALPEIIAEIKAAGYEILRLDELLGVSPYA